MRQLTEAFHELETREGLTVNLLPLYRSAYWHRSSDLVKTIF